MIHSMLSHSQQKQAAKDVHVHPAKEQQQRPSFDDTAATETDTVSVFKHSLAEMPVLQKMPVVQAKLKVNHPGDEYEQEADAIAEEVTRTKENDFTRGKPLYSRITPLIQANSKAGISADPEISERIYSSIGRGSSLDVDTQSYMSNKFGSDFSQVRIHSDNEAAHLNHKIGAKAFTVGNDIYFNRGEYQHGHLKGNHLLAHELTHVLQQNKNHTNSLGNNSQNRNLAIQRAVNTWAGEYDTKIYNPVNTAGVKDGVDIELHFKPGAPVDASMIGMIQKVTSKQGGALLALNATVGARSIPAGKPGEGAHIDQLAQFRNPLYATGGGGANDKLWTTPTNASWGKHGYHTKDKSGVINKSDAVLKDTPQLPGSGPNSSQIFETTAVAITGTQTGAYYGSVQWGWKTDATGNYTKLPLTKVSDDVPGSSFIASQQLWNKSQDSAGNNLIKFYTASAKFVNLDNTSIVSNPKDAVATEIQKLAKNTRVEVINKGLYEEFNKGKPVKWWKITIVDGPFKGSTGWVLSNQLSDTKS